jgi:hypothetical protein
MTIFDDSIVEELRRFLLSVRVDESGQKTPVTSPWRLLDVAFADPSGRTTIGILLEDEVHGELKVILKAGDFAQVVEVPNTSRLSNEAFHISIRLEEQVFSYRPDQLGKVITLHS